MKTLKPEIRAILDKIKGANACEDFVKNEFEKRNLKKKSTDIVMKLHTTYLAGVLFRLIYLPRVAQQKLPL